MSKPFNFAWCIIHLENSYSFIRPESWFIWKTRIRSENPDSSRILIHPENLDSSKKPWFIQKSLVHPENLVSSRKLIFIQKTLIHSEPWFILDSFKTLIQPENLDLSEKILSIQKTLIHLEPWFIWKTLIHPENLDSSGKLVFIQKTVILWSDCSSRRIRARLPSNCWSFDLWFNAVTKED